MAAERTKTEVIFQLELPLIHYDVLILMISFYLISEQLPVTNFTFILYKASGRFHQVIVFIGKVKR